MTEVQMARKRQLQAMDMESALREMTGDAEMQFRGVQAEAIRAIQDNQSPMVAVMASGRGKSMLFLLPAWVAPEGTTVVVVPLLELRQSVVQRSRRYGIECALWESGRAPEDASIVLVTSDSAATPEFQSFLDRLRETGRLDRIVVDECHAILDDRNNFRKQLLAWLKRFTQARTQLVLLTATLPPSLEGDLCKAIHHPRHLVHIFREQTNRPMVAYCAWSPPKLSEFGLIGWNPWFESRHIVEFIQERIRRAGNGRVIVYANLGDQVRAIAQKLGCEAFLRDDADDPGALSRFIDGTTRVLAARSGVNIGVDVSDIRCVIHIGTPRSLLVYAEEIARAGRDGKRSEAIIVRRPDNLNQSLSWMLEEVCNATAEDMRLVENYMDGGGPFCLRSMLVEYLDGIKHRYCLPRDEALCQGCDNNRWITYDNELSVSEACSSCASDKPEERVEMDHEEMERRNACRLRDMLDTLDARSRQRGRSSSVDSSESSMSTTFILSQVGYLTGDGFDSGASDIK